MAEFALYRSLHTLRSGQAKPARTLSLTPEEALALRDVGLERAQAWELDELTMMLHDLSARLQFWRAEAVEAVCREAGARSLTEALRPTLEARLQADARVRAVRLALEAGREATNRQMTLVYAPNADGGA
jgi:tryptophan 2,3-dioxygenase